MTKLMLLLGLVCASCLPRLAAQQHPQFVFAGSAAQAIVQSKAGISSDRLTGPTFGIEGVLVTNKLWARVRYGQGRVVAKDETGTALFTRDIVDGQLLVGVRAMPWLTVWAGPSARAYTVRDEAQRWLMWTGGATARGSLIPGRMQTFIELWGALSGSITNPSQKAGGRGADVGLETRLTGASPLWGRLSYRIESAHAGDMRDTFEGLTLALVYGLPQ